jgi:fatty acid-binding protein DegV
MLKPLWRDGAFPHRGQEFRPGFNSALETAGTALIGIAISPRVAGIVDARRAAIQPLSVDARFRMLDTDHFGAEIQTLAFEPKFDLPRKEIRKCTR